MADTHVSAAEPPKWRKIAFTAVTALAALVLIAGFGALFALVSPWKIVTFGPSDPHPELHRWHSVQMAATFGLLFGGSLVALVWRPEVKPVVAQFVGVGAVVFTAALVSFDPAVLVVLVMGVLVVVLYPAPRLLLVSPWTGPRRFSWPRLIVALLSAGFLAPDATEALRWQIDGVGGEHAELTHWGLAFGLALLLVVAGLLAAGQRPGAGVLAAITGVTFLYLGVSALTIPDHDGSWGTSGGVLASLAGMVYLATSYVERRRGGWLLTAQREGVPAGQ